MTKLHDNCNLSDLGNGSEADVVALDGDQDLRTRLAELGFCASARVRVVRRAPLGCPLEVDVDGTRFSVRAEVAQGVRVRRA
ncbi:MAG: iron transporter [Planctomycetes bacterium]|nr:iron transporter [Planctomycetota bacterium]